MAAQTPEGLSRREFLKDFLELFCGASASALSFNLASEALALNNQQPSVTAFERLNGETPVIQSTSALVEESQQSPEDEGLPFELLGTEQHGVQTFEVSGVTYYYYTAVGVFPNLPSLRAGVIHTPFSPISATCYEHLQIATNNYSGTDVVTVSGQPNQYQPGLDRVYLYNPGATPEPISSITTADCNVSCHPAIIFTNFGGVEIVHIFEAHLENTPLDDHRCYLAVKNQEQGGAAPAHTTRERSGTRPTELSGDLNQKVITYLDSLSNEAKTALFIDLQSPSWSTQKDAVQVTMLLTQVPELQGEISRIADQQNLPNDQIRLNYSGVIKRLNGNLDVSCCKLILEPSDPTSSTGYSNHSLYQLRGVKVTGQTSNWEISSGHTDLNLIGIKRNSTGPSIIALAPVKLLYEHIPPAGHIFSPQLPWIINLAECQPDAIISNSIIKQISDQEQPGLTVFQNPNEEINIIDWYRIGDNVHAATRSLTGSPLNCRSLRLIDAGKKQRPILHAITTEGINKLWCLNQDKVTQDFTLVPIEITDPIGSLGFNNSSMVEIRVNNGNIIITYKDDATSKLKQINMRLEQVAASYIPGADKSTP